MVPTTLPHPPFVNDYHTRVTDCFQPLDSRSSLCRVEGTQESGLPLLTFCINSRGCSRERHQESPLPYLGQEFLGERVWLKGKRPRPPPPPGWISGDEKQRCGWAGAFRGATLVWARKASMDPAVSLAHPPTSRAGAGGGGWEGSPSSLLSSPRGISPRGTSVNRVSEAGRGLW